MDALIFAGGIATRLWPLTVAVPKALLPLGRHPMLHYAMLEAANAGANSIWVLIGSEVSRSVEEHVRGLVDRNAEHPEVQALIDNIRTFNIHFMQFAISDNPRDRAAAPIIAQLSDFLSEPKLIILPDELLPVANSVTRSLMEITSRHNRPSVAVRGSALPPAPFTLKPKTSTSISTRPGGARGGGARAGDHIHFMGRFVLTKEAVHVAQDLCKGNEIEWADVARALALRQELICVPYGGPYWDTGTHEGYRTATETPDIESLILGTYLS